MLYLSFSVSDPQSEMGKTISTLVTEGLSYLDTRSDFWRQQKPMYARRRDRLMQRKRREVSSSKLAPNEYILKELERIDQGMMSWVCHGEQWEVVCVFLLKGRYRVQGYEPRLEQLHT